MVMLFSLSAYYRVMRHKLNTTKKKGCFNPGNATSIAASLQKNWFIFLPDDISGIVIDWSKAEMKGLKLVIGETTGTQLLRGCRVHWIRSCQRVCDRVASSTDKEKDAIVVLKFNKRGHRKLLKLGKPHQWCL